MTMRAELVLCLEQEVLIGCQKRVIRELQRCCELVERPGRGERILDVPNRRAGLGDIVAI